MLRRPSLLPDVPAACQELTKTLYVFGGDPVSGAPEVALISCDLTDPQFAGYPLPVINNGEKFIVEFMADPLAMGVPIMGMTAEVPLQCDGVPGGPYWANETNIYCDYDPGSGNTWYFKEDIGAATNYYIGVTYNEDVTPRVPTMGLFGIMSLVGLISMFMIRRRKR